MDSDNGYTGAHAVLDAMNKAKTTTDVPKLIQTLKEMKFQYNKGVEQFRACDGIRMTSVQIVRGIGAKAKGWDLGEVVAEYPVEQTLESCENNAKDIPFGQVKLPGK